MYGLSRFVENLNSAITLNVQNCVNRRMDCLDLQKLNIHNCVNSTGNCVHYMYREFEFPGSVECIDLHQSNGKLCTVDVQVLQIQICRKNKYPELRKFNKKLWTLYVRILWVWRKFEYPEF